jgi:hypothetical protein
MKSWSFPVNYYQSHERKQKLPLQNVATQINIQNYQERRKWQEFLIIRSNKVRHMQISYVWLHEQGVGSSPHIA